jgi:hypothetical protein
MSKRGDGEVKRQKYGEMGKLRDGKVKKLSG